MPRGDVSFFEDGEGAAWSARFLDLELALSWLSAGLYDFFFPREACAVKKTPESYGKEGSLAVLYWFTCWEQARADLCSYLYVYTQMSYILYTISIFNGKKRSGDIHMAYSKELSTFSIRDSTFCPSPPYPQCIYVLHSNRDILVCGWSA